MANAKCPKCGGLIHGYKWREEDVTTCVTCGLYYVAKWPSRQSFLKQIGGLYDSGFTREADTVATGQQIQA